MCRAFLRLAWEAAAGNRWGDYLLMRLNLGRRRESLTVLQGMNEMVDMFKAANRLR